MNGFYHHSRLLRYRAPQGAAVCGTRVCLRAEVSGALSQARVELRTWQDGVGETRLPMALRDGAAEIALQLPAQPGLVWYYFILTLPGVKYYVRNMDDMVLLGPNKKQLHRARKEIERFLWQHLGLRLKRNWQVFPVAVRGIDFVGFRFFRTHTTMRRRNFLRFARQCRRVQRMIDTNSKIPYREAAGLLARAGQLRHCNAHKIRVAYFDQIGEKRLKRIVRAESKRRLENAA